MLVAFRCLRAVLGPKVGYFTAFVCYWLVWCLAFPLWIMRGTPFSRLFRRPSHPLGKPAWLGLILLLFPALGAAVTIFARRLRLATPLVLLSSAALAIVNAIGEEVLWRGIYPHVFPRQVTKGQAALVKFVPYICVCYHPHLSIHQPQILLSYFIPTTI